MRATGIIRRIDDLGRIVLPVEVRRSLDISERDELEIFIEQDRVVLQKYERSCIFCGKTQNLVTYRGKCVCRSCAQAVDNP